MLKSGLKLASSLARRTCFKPVSFIKLSPISYPKLQSFGSVHPARLGQSRCYATQAESNLAGFLKEEIEAETELARKNLDGGRAPTIPGFEVKTDEAEVRLSKTHGNEKITITFNVNHSVDPVAHVEAEQGKQDSAPAMISKPSFTVEVEKGQQKLAFECEMYDEDAETEPVDENVDLFQIDEVYVYSGEVADKVYSTTGSVIDGQLYEHLMGYLEERGVDNKFASNLCRFATHYEHAQYVALLKKIQDFMSK